MNQPRHHPPRFAGHQITIAFAVFALPLGGCTSTDLAKVESAAKVAHADVTSPAGRQLLADLTNAALNVGLDIASGNDPGAAVAGIQGAASTLRDYEGLPVAPSGSAVGRAAAAGSGMADLASTLAPRVETLVNNAHQAATQQKVNITSDDILEAIARGFDAVADARPTPSGK